MKSRTTVLILLACFLLLGRIAEAQDPKPDEICQRLFETYITRQVKISTKTVMAATHIVAERGRNTGFWKNVLAELRSENSQSEIGCVRVLGKMLATDALARYTIRRQKETGEISAWLASVRLGPNVVAELVQRGEKADRSKLDHYVVALARSRVPETKEFLQSVLRNDNRSDSAKFHAAVGLAQLAETEGVEWLIANSESSQGHVSVGTPRGAAPGGALSACSVAALQQLSDQRLQNKSEWEAWLKNTDIKLLLNRAVAFTDP
ncbi:hypothetical protein [Planctomycetes bacterium K23_9]|uniref:HEAT repeat domain-containing protein n=1 Tax=Stieleria marina TaxID=1930275 RepID=A0A517NTT7_9BACT|nr:hypothetical protein K239x_24920 [Planctomycetes bacterium K23_9]